MTRRTKILAGSTITLLVLVSIGARPAVAQTSDFLVERSSIYLGALSARIDTDIRVDGDSLRGTPVDFEQDLDLEKDPTVAVLGVNYLIGERHEVGFRYNEVSRDRSTTLTREIVFRDRTFEVMSDVALTFDTRTFELFYTYWLMRRKASAFGLTGGLQVQDFETTLELRQAAVPVSEKADGLLPVPLLGVSYRHLLTEKARFLASATVLPEVHVGDVEAGSFLSIFAAVEYRLARALALGASYTLGDLRVDYGRRSFGGRLSYITEGFQVYGRVLF